MHRQYQKPTTKFKLSLGMGLLVPLWGGWFVPVATATPPRSLAAACHVGGEGECSDACDSCHGYVMSSRNWRPCLHGSCKPRSNFQDRLKDGIDAFGDRLQHCVEMIPIRITFTRDCDSSYCETSCCETSCSDSNCYSTSLSDGQTAVAGMRIQDELESHVMRGKVTDDAGSGRITQQPDSSVPNPARRSHPVRQSNPTRSGLPSMELPEMQKEIPVPPAPSAPSDYQNDPFRDEASNRIRRSLSDRLESTTLAIKPSPAARGQRQSSTRSIPNVVVASSEVVTRRLLSDQQGSALRKASSESEVATVTTAQPVRVANGVYRSLMDRDHIDAKEEGTTATKPSITKEPENKAFFRLIPVPHDSK